MCVILVPAAAVLVSLRQPKTYTSTAELVFSRQQFDQTLSGASGTPSQPVDPARATATDEKLIALPVVADRVATALHSGLTGTQVLAKISAQGDPTTDVATISATDRDPATAARIANTFAQQFIAFRRSADRSAIIATERLVQDQYNRLTDSRKAGSEGQLLASRANQLGIMASLQTGDAQIVQPALVPGAPSSPRPARDGIYGLFVGLLLGVALAFVVQRFDRRFSDPKEVEEEFQRPVLAAVPENRALSRGGGESTVSPAVSEPFNMLHVNLRYFNVTKPIRTVVVTSAAPGDGKSVVAWNLAASAAGSGLRVLLLEADLRRPTFAIRHGLDPFPGLSEVLAKIVPYDDAVRQLDPEQVTAPWRPPDVLLAGQAPPNPLDLLQSERMSELMDRMRNDYDLVVVDTPPVAVVSDAVPLITHADAVVVVIRLRQTRRDATAQVRERLTMMKAPVAGLVINCVQETRTSYYQYGYGAPGRVDENKTEQAVVER